MDHPHAQVDRVEGIRRIVVMTSVKQVNPTSRKNGQALNHSYSVISIPRQALTVVQAPGSQIASLSGRPAEPMAEYTNSRNRSRIPNLTLLKRSSSQINGLKA